jgi:hypothetical protein
VRVCVPHLPQLRLSVAPGLVQVSPPPEQAPNSPQMQVDEQVLVCIPPLPQLCEPVAPALHSPSPAQALQSDQVPLFWQMRVWLPQLPQAPLSVAPGELHGPPLTVASDASSLAASPRPLPVKVAPPSAPGPASNGQPYQPPSAA